MTADRVNSLAWFFLGTMILFIYLSRWFAFSGLLGQAFAITSFVVYPITIGIEYTDLEDFRKQGLGKNIGPLPESYWKAQQISVGFGGIGLVDRAPHPNAARVYINWILSKEGQEAFSRVPRNSRRTDVTPAFPELVPLPGKEYFIGQSEEFRDERVNMLSLAKKAIDGK